jgi:hypothetical protein
LGLLLTDFLTGALLPQISGYWKKQNFLATRSGANVKL